MNRAARLHSANWLFSVSLKLNGIIIFLNEQKFIQIVRECDFFFLFQFVTSNLRHISFLIHSLTQPLRSPPSSLSLSVSLFCLLSFSFSHVWMLKLWCRWWCGCRCLSFVSSQQTEKCCQLNGEKKRKTKCVLCVLFSSAVLEPISQQLREIWQFGV